VFVGLKELSIAIAMEPLRKRAGGPVERHRHLGYTLPSGWSAGGRAFCG
jgi:hypothetical protein